jgi:hypothetical protein
MANLNIQPRHTLRVGIPNTDNFIYILEINKLTDTRRSKINLGITLEVDNIHEFTKKINSLKTDEEKFNYIKNLYNKVNGKPLDTHNFLYKTIYIKSGNITGANTYTLKYNPAIKLWRGGKSKYRKSKYRKSNTRKSKTHKSKYRK